MMRRRPCDPPTGRLLNGRRYASEAEYRAALAARVERRRRILAGLDLEHDDVFGGA